MHSQIENMIQSVVRKITTYIVTSRTLRPNRTWQPGLSWLSLRKHTHKWVCYRMFTRVHKIRINYASLAIRDGCKVYTKLFISIEEDLNRALIFTVIPQK